MEFILLWLVPMLVWSLLIYSWIVCGRLAVTGWTTVAAYQMIRLYSVTTGFKDRYGTGSNILSKLLTAPTMNDGSGNGNGRAGCWNLYPSSSSG